MKISYIRFSKPSTTILTGDWKIFGNRSRESIPSIENAATRLIRMLIACKMAISTLQGDLCMASAEKVPKRRVALPAARTIPEAVWAPIAGASLVALPGIIGLAAGSPLLFASLGPTAFLQAAQPQQPTARFHNVVLGHAVGFLAGVIAVALFSASTEPSLFEAKQLGPPRVCASVLAVALTLFVSAPRKIAFHPPAAATTLLVALGGFAPSWSSALTVLTGVLVVAVAGELLRRLRLAQQSCEASESC
jgi:hypothetical protein